MKCKETGSGSKDPAVGGMDVKVRSGYPDLDYADGAQGAPQSGWRGDSTVCKSMVRVAGRKFLQSGCRGEYGKVKSGCRGIVRESKVWISGDSTGK
jgi:hypothetical protein